MSAGGATVVQDEHDEQGRRRDRPEDIERLFRPWLDWSSAEEIRALLDVVVRELRARGYTITLDVRRPEAGPRPGDDEGRS